MSQASKSKAAAAPVPFEQTHVMGTYARQDVIFERGEGAWLISTTGDRYLDFASGVAVNSLGHAHPKLIAALTEQASKLWHTSNLYRVAGQETLSEKLCKAAPWADKIFFCLVTTLKGKGPFTVFAPTNAAFDKLPAGTVTTLLKPENKAQLAKILTYHVVSGNLDAAAVVAAIKAGKGKATLTTVSGGKLTGSLEGEKVKLTDESGNSVYVVVADLKGSNGVVHVIDGVVLPK